MSARKPKTGTIFWLSVILDHEGLDAVDKLLLIGLADHVDAEDRAWPGLETLARRAGKSYITARRRLAALTDRGYIERTRRHRQDGSFSTYEYRLVREAFELDPLPSTDHEPDVDQRSPVIKMSDGPALTLDERTRRTAQLELEEEESPGDDLCLDDEPTDADLAPLLDEVIHDVAAELRRLRDRDQPDTPVKQRRPWLAKARKRLRQDEATKRAALIARHPAGGCAGRPDARQRTVAALAQVHRNGEWPAVPPARRRVELADTEVFTNVHTEDPATPMPASVRDQIRDALTGARK